MPELEVHGNIRVSRPESEDETNIRRGKREDNESHSRNISYVISMIHLPP